MAGQYRFVPLGRHLIINFTITTTLEVLAMYLIFRTFDNWVRSGHGVTGSHHGSVGLGIVSTTFRFSVHTDRSRWVWLEPMTWEGCCCLWRHDASRDAYVNDSAPATPTASSVAGNFCPGGPKPRLAKFNFYKFYKFARYTQLFLLIYLFYSTLGLLCIFMTMSIIVWPFRQ